MSLEPSHAEPGYAKYASPAYPQTFGELLDWSIARIAEPEQKVYFRITGQAPLTYAEFGRNVRRICSLLTALGMQQGEHVAIFLPNCVEYAYLYHSLGKCGLVMVPLNQFLRGESLSYIVKHSDARYIITSRALFEEKLTDIQGALPDINRVLFIDALAPNCSAPASLFSDFREHDSSFVPVARGPKE